MPNHAQVEAILTTRKQQLEETLDFFAELHIADLMMGGWSLGRRTLLYISKDGGLPEK